MVLVDCFIFYNELDLLRYRLALLSEFVDYFVIVESKHTFSGIEKILYFDQNKTEFKDYQSKIIHIVVEDMPHVASKMSLETKHHWANEYHQRDSIARGIGQLKLQSSDLLIISDADEIPDPRFFDTFKIQWITC